MTKTKLNLSIDADIIKNAKKICIENGISLSCLIEEMLRHEIKVNNKEKKIEK